MSDTLPIETDTHAVTPAMRRFTDYFGELGPRWGIRAETTRAHALLYLAGRPLSRDELAVGLDISKPRAAAALRDLQDWGMAAENSEGGWRAGGEPWDLLFRALEARRRREIAPALEAMRACREEATADPETPRAVRRRIEGVLTLVENIAAIDGQARRLPRSLMPRLVRITGTASRMLGRLAATAPGRRT